MAKSKDEIRAEKLFYRQNLDKKYYQKSNRIIRKKLLKLPAFQLAKTIGIYYSVNKEVDTLKIIKYLLKHKYNVVLPRTVGAALQFHQINNLQTDLRYNAKYKLYEPDNKLPIYAPQLIDVMIIPLLSYDLDHHRLGYGKGFYDRYLKDFRGTKIGLGYHFQFVEKLPCELHDIPLDIVVTN
ncbi:5-formyltetrahydrofolate cyclo-ligase [Spiroplasma eriocheiris]|uniref:5-formyltetrahydrofolate cyclo-ligase n=1 Tax=Spiroplasma eriocheiris TaxID=315358 RepID=A0A0H3XIK7_9MOLU|nr:5-formyltetrahydrofolate cyclo-ligase [Spiroplasma eriocheiris]AHF58271.1 putative 5-formyltetrahydrofolate cyclo-ligase [Spiroplasma eriocheiris CCTCC M 207170]AKM54708.1 5-formyltetrahydrofolate cyclo-ligase [Spiroplasma eriocheiris]